MMGYLRVARAPADVPPGATFQARVETGRATRAAACPRARARGADAHGL